VSKANTSVALWAATKKELLGAADPARTIVVTELQEGGALLSRNLLTFVKTRDLALPAPELQVAVEARGVEAAVRVTAKRFAQGVYLSTTNGAGTFSDNFFDLLPGETVTVTYKPAAGGNGAAPAPDAAQLSAALRIVSVRDTY
jgi:beta-mannosidase